MTNANDPKPNVVLVLLDDLGFVDTSYYASTTDEFYGTSPILDSLAANGVKFNYHYSEATCSPSRAALLTGRYSYRNGIDQALVYMTNKVINEKYPLLPEILRDNGYNTFMSGKWHLGNNNIKNVPPGRGFDESIYYEGGNVDPFQRTQGISFGFTYQGVWPQLLQDPNIPISTKQQIQQLMSPDGYRVSIFHDFHKNTDYKYMMSSPQSPPEYVDTTFIKEALQYLDTYSSDKPFFMYLSLQSPHSPIVDPCSSPWPNYLPAPCDSAVKFAECEHITSDIGRKNLCRMIADSSQKIESVINKLKEMGEYENTVFIVLSDNGGQNNFLGDFGDNALAFGQNLPFRGAKASVFEGGIRTAAILTGGYIDNNYPDLINCEYSDLIYIADWFNIILSGFAGIDTASLDIDAINLLDHINYVCANDKDQSSDSDDDDNKPQRRNRPTKREEIISFRYCDPSQYGINGGIQAGYVRTKDYKLVINGSYTADCGFTSDDAFGQIFIRQGLYLNYDGSGTAEPNTQSYINTQKNNENKKLFKSQCFDKYLRNPVKNPIDTIQKELMLFNIKRDKIEACNIADDEQDIVERLYQKIIDEIPNGEYMGSQVFDQNALPIGSLYALYEDYQCPLGESRNWEEIYQQNGSPDTITVINDVYTKISTCPNHPFPQQSSAKNGDYIYNINNNGNDGVDGIDNNDGMKIKLDGHTAMFIGGILIVLLFANFTLFVYSKTEKRDHIKYKVVSNVTDTDTDINV